MEWLFLLVAACYSYTNWLGVKLLPIVYLWLTEEEPFEKFSDLALFLFVLLGDYYMWADQIYQGMTYFTLVHLTLQLEDEEVLLMLSALVPMLPNAWIVPLYVLVSIGSWTAFAHDGARMLVISDVLLGMYLLLIDIPVVSHLIHTLAIYVYYLAMSRILSQSL